MTINERVRVLRKSIGLTQIEFGQRIAVAQGYLTNIENGNREVTEKTIKLICLQFNVNETWLRTGDGEMFVQTDNAVLTALINEYGLDGIDAKILEAYIALPSEHRQVVKSFICGLAKAVLDGTTTDIDIYTTMTKATAPVEQKVPFSRRDRATLTEDEIDEEVEAYRRDLLEEKRVAARLLASGDANGN